jgi:hypothetical protein
MRPTKRDQEMALADLLDTMVRMIAHAHGFASDAPVPSAEVLKHEVQELVAGAMGNRPLFGHAELHLAYRACWRRVGEILKETDDDRGTNHGAGGRADRPVPGNDNPASVLGVEAGGESGGRAGGECLGEVLRRMAQRRRRGGGSVKSVAAAAFFSTVAGVLVGWMIVVLMTRHGWWLPWR